MPSICADPSLKTGAEGPQQKRRSSKKVFSVLPREEILTKAVKGPAFGASPVEHTIDVLSRLSFEDCPNALVLDDFHFITNEELTKSLLYVIKRLPLSFTTLILSRAELPRAFSQYAESGKVAYINAGELAFKRDEIRRHFASFGRFLTVMEAEEAFAFTEGWPIAVNALVMGGNVPTDEPLQHNPLRNYIKAQIWDKLDVELRSFMLQTSVADKFSEELCRRITGNPESRQILHTLLGENMFLSHREGEYRYHHLFLDFLREELAAEPSIHVKTLYERAAGYYFDAGDNFNALGFFIKCGCSQGIADALSRFLTFHVEASSDMWSISYINKLPPQVLEENPCLYISCAWCAFFFGEAEELRKLCDGYNRKLDVAEADVLLAIILWLTGDRQEAAGLLQRTLSEMRPYGYVRVFADEGKAILPVLKRLMKKMDMEKAPLGAPEKAANGAPGKATDDTKKAPDTAPDMAERSFLKEVYLAAYEQGKRYKGIACPDEIKPVKLSGQQKRMLELLAQGYKNAEIVALTGLSINTLRYHTKEAYRKLNVTNAADVILRARELGLIRS